MRTHFKNKNNQGGFAHISFLLAVIVVVAIGYAGYRVMHSSSAATENKTFGMITPASTATSLSDNTKVASPAVPDSSGKVTSLSFYLDGNGGRAHSSGVAASIYADSNSVPVALLASSDTLQIKAHQSARWVSFTLTQPIDVTAGTKYWLTLSTGSKSVVRVYSGTTAGASVAAANSGARPSPMFGSITQGNGLLSAYATYTVTIPDPVPTPNPTPNPADLIFKGDFETGNASQWPVCQNIALNSSCSNYSNSSYSLQIENTVKRQGNYAARFELRNGDIPFSNTERTEVQGDTPSGGLEGSDRWYQWSTQFGSGFPTTGNGDWGVISQWHDDASTGSPPVSFNTDVGTGMWGLRISQQSSPGVYVNSYIPWKTSMVTGSWIDIKTHIHWSTSDSLGYVELWINGARQTFSGAPCAGQQRCTVRTLIPGGGGASYFKQGYYRCSCSLGTGVIYHDGFSSASTEAGLSPL